MTDRFPDRLSLEVICDQIDEHAQSGDTTALTEYVRELDTVEKDFARNYVSLSRAYNNSLEELTQGKGKIKWDRALFNSGIGAVIVTLPYNIWDENLLYIAGAGALLAGATTLYDDVKEKGYDMSYVSQGAIAGTMLSMIMGPFSLVTGCMAGAVVGLGRMYFDAGRNKKGEMKKRYNKADLELIYAQKKEELIDVAVNLLPSST